MQRIRISEIRIAAEQAIDHRTDEALFEQVLRLRLLQRQRGEQRQVDGAVGHRARAYSALTMWLALPRPSGSPTTSSVPTSRMMCSAIASGSEKNLRHRQWTRSRRWTTCGAESAAGGSSLYFIRLTCFACDEPATDKATK